MDNQTKLRKTIWLVLLGFVLLLGCESTELTGEPGAASDTDTDSDSDSETDTDSSTDTDSDSDTDFDTDWENDTDNCDCPDLGGEVTAENLAAAINICDDDLVSATMWSTSPN